MLYRNKNNGVTIFSEVKISGKNWECVETKPRTSSSKTEKVVNRAVKKEKKDE